jgi:hypothetical protein
VGSTPVIMGKKLRTTYHKGANYIETDVDISNSKVRGIIMPQSNEVVFHIQLEGPWNNHAPE